jgi:hypothetical protein
MCVLCENVCLNIISRGGIIYRNSNVIGTRSRFLDNWRVAWRGARVDLGNPCLLFRSSRCKAGLPRSCWNCILELGGA